LRLQDFDNSLFTTTGILLGVGALLVYVGVLRYFGFFSQYNVSIFVKYITDVNCFADSRVDAEEVLAEYWALYGLYVRFVRRVSAGWLGDHRTVQFEGILYSSNGIR
jgi:hypothetical protein